MTEERQQEGRALLQFPEFIGASGAGIVWSRAIGFLVALVVADLPILVREVIRAGISIDWKSWLIILLADLALAGFAVLAFRWIRSAATAVIVTALGYTAVMSGIRWLVNGFAFQTIGDPPKLLEPALAGYSFLYAFLLLGALVLLVARLKPVWLVLGMGYLAGTLISNLAFQAMLMLYFHSSPSIGYLLESSLIALASAAVFAGVLWLFVRTLTVLRQPELGSAACEGVAPLQMGLGRLLFSFTGRITRSQFWLTNLCLFPFSALGWALALSEKLELILVLLPLVLLLTFCGVSLSVKRLHDRDKGSWWLATTLIPLAGLIIALWLLVEIWFLRGTRGVNRFGPDPLQPSSSAETTLHLE